MPLLNIFKKENDPLSLKEIVEKIDTVTEEEVYNAGKNTSSWSEIKGRHDSLTAYIRKLPPKPAETPEETATRRRNLMKKADVLLRCLNELEQKQKDQRTQSDATYSEEAATRELANVRYSTDSIVRMMQLNGVNAVPLNAAKWLTPEGFIIEVPCPNSQSRKLDLRKLPRAYWEMLEQTRFTPLFIPAESSAVIIDGKKQGLWLDTEFHANKQIQIQPTYVALMLV